MCCYSLGALFFLSKQKLILFLKSDPLKSDPATCHTSVTLTGNWSNFVLEQICTHALYMLFNDVNF
jgi:hypothetical protein